MLRFVSWSLAAGASTVTTAAPLCDYVVLPVGGQFPPVYLKPGECSMAVDDADKNHAWKPVCEEDGSLSIREYSHTVSTMNGMNVNCDGTDYTDVYDEWVSAYNNGEPLEYSCAHGDSGGNCAVSGWYEVECAHDAVLAGNYWVKFMTDECTPYAVDGKTGAFKMTGECGDSFFYDDTECSGASTVESRFWDGWAKVLGAAISECNGECLSNDGPFGVELRAAGEGCSNQAYSSQHCWQGDDTHQACVTCGFYPNATDANSAYDCITCGQGDEIDVVFDDCTGFCVPQGTAGTPLSSSSCTSPQYTTPCDSDDADGARAPAVASVLLGACSVLAWLL